MVIAIEITLIFDEVEIPTKEKTTFGEDRGGEESTANAARRRTTAPAALAIFWEIVMSSAPYTG